MILDGLKFHSQMLQVRRFFCAPITFCRKDLGSCNFRCKELRCRSSARAYENKNWLQLLIFRFCEKCTTEPPWVYLLGK